MKILLYVNVVHRVRTPTTIEQDVFVTIVVVDVEGGELSAKRARELVFPHIKAEACRRNVAIGRCLTVELSYEIVHAIKCDVGILS